jgi:predicted enzyme related to lactoylglutathione lyase
MSQISPQIASLGPRWATCFTVTDADETAREALKLGARLCAPVQDVPGVGRFCGMTSAQGVTFCAINHTH